MNKNVEQKVRAALAEQVSVITSATLRHPDLPKPRRRRRSAPVAVAAFVIALLVGGSVGMTALRSPDNALAAALTAAQQVPSVTAGTALAAASGHTSVEGIVIPTPTGWVVTEMAPSAGARHVCLAPAGEDSASCARGVAFIIAATVRGITSTISLQPPDLCPNAQQVMTYFPAAALDGRDASRYVIQCDEQGPVAEYWQLADQSLSISTPLDDDAQPYLDIITGINLSGWAHQP